MKWSIPERVIEKGRNYLKEGRVLSVTADEENKKWHGQVMGHELYLVELDGTAKEADTCQCLFWQEKGYCKHTIAVELYLRQLGLNRLMNENFQGLAPKISFHELFTQGLVESTLKKSMITEEKFQITYQIESLSTSPYQKGKDVLGLSLKIGYPDKRQYLVKNISEFLMSFAKEEQLIMNQQYPFSLAHPNFLLEDQRILSTLLKIQESYSMLLQGGFTQKGRIEKKFLVLPPLTFKPLLEEIFQTKHGVLLIDGRYEEVSFKKQLPLKSEVVKNSQGYQLTIENPVEQFFNFYHLAYGKGNFYPISLEKENLYQTFQQLTKGKAKVEITYPKEALSTLFSQVLPLLQEISEVSVSSTTKEKIIYEPLQTAFYLGKKQGNIQLRLDFQYGETIFSSNPKKSLGEKSTVVRQIEQEETIKSQLQQLGYQKNTLGFSKVLPEGESRYLFFQEELPYLQSLGKVYLGKKLQGLFVSEKKVKPKMQVGNEDSWLTVRFDVSEVAPEEVADMLKALSERHQFYETKEGKIVDLQGEVFQEAGELLKKLRGKIQKDGTIHLAKYQSLALKELAEKNKNLQFNDSFKEMVQNLNQPKHFSTSLPKGLQATLRNYQQEGFQWLKMLSHYGLGGILADEMGLGKTLQAITYLLSQKETGLFKKPTLIVAPASLTYNWLSEFEKFAPSLKVLPVAGTKEERQAGLSEALSYDVLITSYASFRQDQEEYLQIPFNCLFLDEAQMVKNAATKTAQALKKLKVPQRFALSGTPIENNIEELWALFSIIMPGFFPTKGKFRQLELATIQKMIQPFILRREKQHVLKELPPKIETNLYSSLLPEQKTVYLAYLEEMQKSFQQMGKQDFAKHRLSILAGLTRLRQICCDPRLFMEDFVGNSGKLEQLKDFLTNAKENGKRVLIFSQFTKMLDIIQDSVASLGIESFYLKGSTPSKERIEMVNAFNEGQKDIFLISLKAGGTGLNLTGADTVVLFDLWWNPAVEEQAAGRAHRMGQKKVVEVFKMIAKGTVEEKMAALQEEKRALFDEVLQGNPEKQTSLTEEDIRMILSIGE